MYPSDDEFSYPCILSECITVSRAQPQETDFDKYIDAVAKQMTWLGEVFKNDGPWGNAVVLYLPKVPSKDTCWKMCKECPDAKNFKFLEIYPIEGGKDCIMVINLKHAIDFHTEPDESHDLAAATVHANYWNGILLALINKKVYSAIVMRSGQAPSFLVYPNWVFWPRSDEPPSDAPDIEPLEDNH